MGQKAGLGFETHSGCWQKSPSFQLQLEFKYLLLFFFFKRKKLNLFLKVHTVKYTLLTYNSKNFDKQNHVIVTTIKAQNSFFLRPSQNYLGP